MTAISVTSVNVLDNPSKVTNPLQFEIQYECMFDLADGEAGALRAGRAAGGVGAALPADVALPPATPLAVQPPRPRPGSAACLHGSPTARSAAAGNLSGTALHMPHLCQNAASSLRTLAMPHTKAQAAQPPRSRPCCASHTN